jgi:polyhydroxyalkanoate synthesis repressor PhaR
MPIRVIKKYPNRRLYDTERSSYITFEDVKELILRHVPLKVIDAKTQEDLTNNILLQIVMDLEQKGAPVFTTTILEQMIRFYGNDLQKTFSDFLAQSFAVFKDQPAKNYMHTWKEMMDQWQEMFRPK